MVDAVYQPTFKRYRCLGSCVISVVALAAPGAKHGGQFTELRSLRAHSGRRLLRFARSGSITSVDSIYHSGENKRILEAAAYTMV